MKICISFLFFLISFLFFAQTFPSPQQVSTGQGVQGSIDPNWQVSSWFTSSPPNPIGLNYIATLINNNCAPGAWVDPQSLPYPLNTSNWITGIDADCQNNDSVGHRYFRLILNLPEYCNELSVMDSGSYILNLSAYVDNTIHGVFLNGVDQNISGGAFQVGNQLDFTIAGPWNIGNNYIDLLVYNLPEDLDDNPYGLLVVLNSTLSSASDMDGDLVNDLLDFCPCKAGVLENGCNPSITEDTTICRGETVHLAVNDYGTYLWSTGETTQEITVLPDTTQTFTCVISKNDGTSETLSTTVYVNYTDMETVMIPNVLTPNNDQVNDLIDFNNFFEGCVDFNFEVYNRWGNLVFSQVNNTEAFAGSDKNGNVLQEGVYFYSLKYSEGIKNGFIQLLK